MIKLTTGAKKKEKTEKIAEDAQTSKDPKTINEEVKVQPMEQEEPDATIEDLPGVGPATAEKLREAGFDELLAIAVMTPAALADAAELGESVSAKIIAGAKKMANIGGFISGGALMERRREIMKVSSGVESLDTLLGGGFETQALVEVYGAFGSGKTQVAHQLAVNCTMPLSEGGMDGDVFYIDTEDTFRPERIIQMSNALNLDPDIVLARIHVARAYNTAHQILLVDEIKRMSSSMNIKMVVVDSLTSHFRSEYIGRGMLADRQQKLNRHLKELKQLADVNNALVFMTNQVHSKPDAMWGDPTKPVGGHVLAHASTFRIYLRKAKAGRRIARLVDSPNLPDGECVFQVTEDGLCD